MLVGGAASNVQNLPIEAESGVGRWWWWKSNLGAGQQQREDSNYGTNPTKCNFNPRNKFRQKKRKFSEKFIFFKEP